MAHKPYPPTLHNSFLLDPRNKPIMERKKGQLYAFQSAPFAGLALALGIPIVVVALLSLHSLGTATLDDPWRVDTYVRLGVCLLFSPVPMIFLPLAIRNRRRRKRLEQADHLLPGHITQVKKIPIRAGGYVIEICYTFSTPDGVTIAGKNSAPRYQDSKEPLPPINQQVAVLYANDHIFTAL